MASFGKALTAIFFGIEIMDLEMEFGMQWKEMELEFIGNFEPLPN